MAKNRYDEDLFKDSTMTFGEHLEELRGCLFKSAIGLAIGFAIGLLIGDRVLKFFEVPLTKALKENQTQIALEKRVDEIGALPAAKQVVPKEDPQYKLIQDGWIPIDYQIDPRQLLEALEKVRPGAVPAEAAPPEAAKEPPAPLTKNDLMELRVWLPVDDVVGTDLISTGAMEAFMMWIKASLVAGVVIAAPWIFYQIWNFVAAGLYPHEKHYVHLFLPFSLGLFFLGAATAYLFVFAPVLNFLFSFNRWLGIGTQMRINEWMSFVLLMPLGFGVSFQLPLVMLFVERIGIVTVDMYTSKWRIAVLGIFVLAMVLTPSGDPYSMMMMAAPLSILYWIGIMLCKHMPRGTRPHEEFAETAS